MEKATATKSSKSKASSADKIKKGYMEYLLEHGSKPTSIFKFVKELKVKEEAFYDHFNSFEGLEKEILQGYLQETIDAISADPVYDEYSAREKLLAFYYTFVEVLKGNRSYILLVVPPSIRSQFKDNPLGELRAPFKTFVNELLLEAKETEEVQARPYISDKYDEVIWLQFLFVFNFWVKDDSKAFVKTDAAIEKAVNLSFELMGRGPLDAMIDFGKFLYQNR